MWRKTTHFSITRGPKKTISSENLKYFELNANGSPTYEKLGDAGKTVLRGKCIALNVYIRKKKDLKSIIQVSTLGNQEKQSKLNPK